MRKVIPVIRRLTQRIVALFGRNPGIPAAVSEPARAESAIKGEFLPFKRDVRGFVHANGWVCDTLKPERELAVEIWVDDMFFAVVPADRPLPPNESRPLGARAFRVVAPPNFAAGRTIEIIARVSTTSGLVDIGRRSLRSDPTGELLAESRGALPARLRQPLNHSTDSTIAAIIVTQDGDRLLKGLLASICEFEQDTFRRIVIVDHESSDATAEVVREFAARLPVRLLPASRESSFSSSNNSGARECDEDVLVFLNNDIVFTAPAIKSLVSHLGPDVGLASLKLMDAPPGGSATHRIAAQDVGVHFWPTPKVTLPFESRWLSDFPEANDAAVETPAVTAALVAVENKVFRELGGFDERYFYGWEDVDLNMKALASGRVNVSVNSVAAVHLRGQTRHKLSQAQGPRRAKNPEIFAADWEYSLRRALVRDQFERIGFWTGRKAHVGIFVRAGAGEAARESVASIGVEIATHLPCRVFHYEDSGPADFSGLDALLSVGGLPATEELRSLASTAWVGIWAEDVSAESLERYSADFCLGMSEGSSPTSPSEAAKRFVEELKRRSQSGMRVLFHLEEASLESTWPSRELVLAVRSELERCGHSARIALSGAGDDRADAIVRIAAAPPPLANQINILWIPENNAGEATPDLSAYDDHVGIPLESRAGGTVAASGEAKEIARVLDAKLRALDIRKMRFR